MRALLALHQLLRAERGGGAVETLRRGAERGKIAVDEAGVEIAFAELGGAAECGKEAGIAARTDDDGLVERARQPVERLVAAVAMRDQLGDHRIVERRDLAALFDAGIDAQALAFGNCSATSLPVDGRKPRSGSSA